MLAVPINEGRLTRSEYWKRVGLFVAALFMFGFLAGLSGVSDEVFAPWKSAATVLGWVMGVYWGRQRCVDAGWNPNWALLNWSFLSYVIFGIPKTKDVVEEINLELVDEDHQD